MKLVEMTIEEALMYSRGNKNEKVLVAVYDLEDCYGLASFQKKDRNECENIIRKAKTIAKECDDLINSLQCFSQKQDLKAIRPAGTMATILYNDIV